ncbi:MAG: LysM peptidoglycan-binding domain-containing protein [Flavobacteriaceae bacterium]|tara:strand:+ start:730 stop:2637 length:1908 start_codon:yes stop_codon:yes gene_type:complete
MKTNISIIVFMFLFSGVYGQELDNSIIDKQISVRDFIRINNITENDFFILNEKYTIDRFSNKKSDLDKILAKNDTIVVYQNKYPSDEEIRFINHKIKRKQKLSQISKIYDVDESIIKKYNFNTKILKNNVLKIPIFGDGKELKNLLTLHVVKPKEGKWRIANEYGVSVNFLEKLNPKIGKVLKIKQRIAVPVLNNKIYEKSNNLNDLEYFEVDNKVSSIELENELGLEKNSIALLNPSIKNINDLQGLIIKIPKKEGLKQINTKLNQSSNIDNISNLDLKKIALILPFRLERIDLDSIHLVKNNLKNDKLLNISLDFLFGAEMALNKFSKLGIDVKMDVFDNSLSKKRIDEIIKNNNIDDYDFVIGPLTNDLFDYFVNSIPLSDTKIIKTLGKKSITSKNVINTIPHDSIYFNRVIEKVKNDTLKSGKFIISDSKKINISEKLKKIFPDAQQFYSKINDSGIDTKTLVFEDLDSTFVDGRNILFLETNDQGFVSNVTSILNSFISDDQEIVLYTTNKNKAFEGDNISNTFLSNLKFQYASTNRIIDKNINQDFINDFIAFYKFYPNKYSIRAYDIVYDLLLRYSNGDIDDPENHENQTEYLENKFKYYRTSTGSLDNISVYFLKHENLNVNQINN